VGVVSFDRGDQGGHFGTGWRVAVAVLTEIWWFLKNNEKSGKKIIKRWHRDLKGSDGMGSGSGRVGAVPLDREHQGGSNGGG
jgi:hypothetical protein